MEHITFKRASTHLFFGAGLTLAACAGTDRDLGDTEGAISSKSNVDATEEATDTVTAVETDTAEASAPSGEVTDEATDTASQAETAEAEEADGRSGIGRESATCDPDTFEEAANAVFSLEHLYGVWTDEVMVSDLGLPSGSKLVTLTIAENHITLTLGEEEDPRPLLDGRLGVNLEAREGFEYTLIPGEVVYDEYPDQVGGVYPEAFKLTATVTEPLAALCAEEEPGSLVEGACGYSCLPDEAVLWSTIEETSEAGTCIVNGALEIPCDVATLCTEGCRCDADACDYNPGTQLELVAGMSESGWLELSLPEVWTLANIAPTPIPGGPAVAQLSRE